MRAFGCVKLCELHHPVDAGAQGATSEARHDLRHEARDGRRPLRRGALLV